MKILFSIIIPTFNRQKLLPRAVRSVLNQSYQNFELIIIDDGSTYDVEKLINSFKDPRIVFYQQKNKERSAARNFGITKARGNYICFLDDDDEYEIEYLDDFYNYYKKTGNYKTILRTGFKTIDNKGNVILRKNYEEKKNGNPVSFFSMNMSSSCTLSIPKLYLQNDHFPENFPHWQDTHLLLRLLAKFPFQQLDTHNYIYHFHKGMGSFQAMSDENIEQRLQLNLDAIDDLFDNYDNLLMEYISKRNKTQIYAKKYLDFAVGAARSKNTRYAIQYLRASLRHGMNFKFLKDYLRIPYLLYIKNIF